jgi:hypothetical protein
VIDNTETYTTVKRHAIKMEIMGGELPLPWFWGLKVLWICVCKPKLFSLFSLISKPTLFQESVGNVEICLFLTEYQCPLGLGHGAWCVVARL